MLAFSYKLRTLAFANLTVKTTDMDIDNQTILNNELENDGWTINLYFNTQVGLYVAYGFSAFFAAHIIDVITAFSEELEMPVALMRKPDVDELRLSTEKQQHDIHRYYALRLKHAIPLDDYVRWGTGLKWK